MLSSKSSFTVYIKGPHDETFFKIQRGLWMGRSRLRVYINENEKERLIGGVQGHYNIFTRNYDLYEVGAEKQRYGRVQGHFGAGSTC